MSTEMSGPATNGSSGTTPSGPVRTEPPAPEPAQAPPQPWPGPPGLFGGSEPAGPPGPVAGPMDAPPPAGTASWRRLTAREGRRFALVALVLVLLGAVSGFLGSFLVTPRYAAESDLLYVITREQPTGFLREDRNLTTQLVLLGSRTVIDPVAAKWSMTSQQLSSQVTTTLVPESEVIHIEVRDTDPQRATDILGALTARYLEVSNNDRRTSVQSYLDGQLRDVVARLNATPGASSAERAPLVDREQQLRGQLDELNVADLAGPAAEVLAPAAALPDPVSPSRGFAAGAGALTGLLLALIAVAVLARRAIRR